MEKPNNNKPKIINVKSICKTLPAFFPSIWFPIIINNIGENLHLVKQNSSKLNVYGWIFTILVYASAFFYGLFVMRKKDDEKSIIEDLENTNKQQKANLDIYENLLDSISDVCITKYDTLQEYIKRIVNEGKCDRPFDSSIKPEVQLKNIAKEIKSCLNNITRVKKGNLVISLAYNFPQKENKWKWIDSSELHGCEKIDTLVSNQKSTFYKIMINEVNFTFYNDKIEAQSHGNYVFDTRDNSNRCIGSIICESIDLDIDGVIIARIILSASSYSCRFTDSKDKEIIDNIGNTIKNVILQQYEKRIRIELAELYIKREYQIYNNINMNENSAVQVAVASEEKQLAQALI